MITIVEPKPHIDKLWGQQKVKPDQTYRLMRYTLRVDHEGKVLLHNVVTGRLVVLSEEEAKALETLPAAYNPAMEKLVAEHYLVPEELDEHQQVVNLRNVLRRIEAIHSATDITYYMILPTTACNARCYYCYQHDLPKVVMSSQTADDVIRFICDRCGAEKKIFISWFGGEPTVSIDRIDQICEGLRKNGIEYRAFMISNGYLFDSDVVAKAKTLWNLQRIQITVDGTEGTYNRTKAYVNVCDNPFERIMRNIGLLLDSGIAVELRMNYDVSNWNEFEMLVEEAKKRFHNNDLLRVVVHQILGEHPNHSGKIKHGSESWFEAKRVELDAITRNAGLHGKVYELPYMRFAGCQASSDAAVIITPEGNLVSCPEQLGYNQIKGNVRDGVTNTEMVQEWKQFVDYPKCVDCCFKPYCIHMLCCTAGDKCTSKKAYHVRSLIEMQHRYDTWSKIANQSLGGA